MSAQMPPEPKPARDLFSSRWALILVAIGMAVGTGNIWRFPRIMSKFDGGGTFLIPWLIFLFTWSIPLLIVEFSIGKRTRRGVVASLGTMMGRKRTWIGAFVALCTIAIMSYYAVVAGWCAIYIVDSLRGATVGMNTDQASAHFLGVAEGPYAIVAMAGTFAVGGAFVARGLRGGVERANKIFLPLLFGLLVVLLVAGLMREGSGKGIAYIFRVDAAQLGTASPWLEALSQSAFSTGAGWGLMLTFAVGSSSKANGVGTGFITGIGNNVASLVAAMATIPAVFALAPLAHTNAIRVLQTNTPGNTGMAMVWIPRLFNEIGSMGRWLSAAFFLALTFAAITSLIAMLELATRSLMDLGLRRTRAIVFVCIAGAALGLPSAANIGFLDNQDWAWGLGLLVSGLLCVVAVGHVGFDRFRVDWINGGGDGVKLGRWFNVVLVGLIPLQFLVLVGWWFYTSISQGWTKAWWNPLETYSLGTCVVQWGLAFVLLLSLNKLLARSVPEDS